MFKLEKLLDRLTDNYAKNPESRIGRLLRIMSEQLQDLGDTFTKIEEWRDIDNAEGKPLDDIGGLVKQSRGTTTDEIYRVLIKSKIAQNLSTGDINTIITVLSVALDAEYSEIKIEETYNDEVDPEPAAIRIVELPLRRINEAGMSPEQFGIIVQRTVSAGVRVGVIELTGTFEFGHVDDYPEIDEEAGFADIDGTIGGYLGAAFSSDQNTDLPI